MSNNCRDFKCLVSFNFQSYGTRPSKSDIQSREENCPICQDDYKDPVMLACKVVSNPNNKIVTIILRTLVSPPLCNMFIHLFSYYFLEIKLNRIPNSASYILM